MVDTREELADVALQDPDGACAIAAHLTIERVEPPDGPMRPFAYPAGIRIGDEGPVEEGIEHAVDGMGEQSVTDTRLVNVPRLRIGDLEPLIAAMGIAPIDNIIA